MLKQGLSQKQQQKLSPLQIQTITMLGLSRDEAEQKIKEEFEKNPVLEEQKDDGGQDENGPKKVSLSDYPASDPTPSYKLYVNNQGKDLKPQYNTFSVKEGFLENLESQLGFKKLDDRKRLIARQIIGSLDGSGYLTRGVEDICDDIAFHHAIEVSESEVEEALKIVQSFDPVGVGARDLQECLLLQIRAKSTTPSRAIAEKILSQFYKEFLNKHFDKIINRLDIDEQGLKSAMLEIQKLNPKPGGQIDDSYDDRAQQINPDFVLEVEGGELLLSMPKFSIPDIKVRKQYSQYLTTSFKGNKSEKEAASFVRKNYDSARWLIEALKQRYNTLDSTMRSILESQKEFFLEGDPARLKPLVLKDIAQKTGFDISTISRAVRGKYIQTPYGIFELKYFFSEKLTNTSGEEVSTREVKTILEEEIGNENKKKPLTDEELVAVLKSKGYNVARRTVAKYRDQLDIPIARLRKEL